MQPGISTYVFFPQRLTATLLDALLRSGAGAIEVMAARHHFDYTDRDAVRELVGWFRSNNVTATMHMPLFSADEEANWSKHTAPSLNLISSHKNSRIDAMDEVKRALEAAEQVPFQSCVLHLGLKGDEWDSRALDDSMTAIEHLKAFAGPLGMKMLLENLNNDVATPEHLVEIVRVGHFSTVGYCLDTGHAQLAEPSEEVKAAGAKSGLVSAFEAFGDKLVELHLHDNHGAFAGKGDEHLLPGEGAIDWGVVTEQIGALKQPMIGMLELGYDLGYDAVALEAKARSAWNTVRPA
ncbi:MAG: sugar phosphate isomerase/epimerase family protein [Acidobacteriota bacterium]